MKKEALRVSTTIPAAPTTLYLAWLTAEQHSEMTSGAAKIDSQVGGNFTALDGYITGKLVTLDLGRRIVMSWRTADFPREAPDSRVEVHFEALGGNTRLTVLHTEIPEGQSEKYRETWNEKYFGPMRSFFSKYLPDPRKPPPPRPPPPPIEEEEEEEEEVEEKPKKVKALKSVPPTKQEPSKPAAPKAVVHTKAAPAPTKSKPAPTKSKPAPTKSKPVPAKAQAKPAKAQAKPAKASAKPAKAGKAKGGKPEAKAPVKKPAAKKPAAKKPAAKKPAKGKKR